MGKETNFI